MPEAPVDRKILNTRWITPETERKLSLSVREKARVTVWDVDISSLRFGLPAVTAGILLLLLQKVGAAALITASVVSLTGVILIARMRGRLAVRYTYNEELSKQSDEYKDYYKILFLSPAADGTAVTTAFNRLSHLFQDVLSRETKVLGGYSVEDVSEAFAVLSDRSRRKAYDRVFWLRTNVQGVQAPINRGQREIVATMQSVAEVMDSPERKNHSTTLKMPSWVNTVGRSALAGFIGLLPVFVGGTSLAFAKPENSLAVPFKGIAASMAKVSSGAIQIIVDMRSIAANQERTVVATAFQAMRLDANLVTVTPARESTNDMSVFPSGEHPLYPGYLETRFSQFKYNVDEYGVVNADPSWAATNLILDSLAELLDKLENKSN